MKHHISLHLIITCFVVSFISITTANAQDRKTAKVDCGKSESINTALSKLSPNEPNRVEVSGTCTENVSVRGFNDLELVASPSAVINDASGGTNSIIGVVLSNRVLVHGFTLKGPSSGPGANFVAGVELLRSSFCFITDNTISGTTNGISLQLSSSASVNNNTITNVSRNGMFVALNSEATIGGIVLDNTGTSLPGQILGLHVERNAAATISPGFGNDSLIRGFSIGIRSGPGSTIDVRGNSAPTATRIIIENNFAAGLAAQAGGHARILGNTRIINNGTVNRTFSGGILIEDGGNVQLFPGNEVSNNLSQGIVLTHNGTATVGGSVISNNQRNGVVAVNSSTIQFDGGNTVSGNTAQDLFCDSQSIITGTSGVSGATKKMCTNEKPFKSDPIP